MHRLAGEAAVAVVTIHASSFPRTGIFVPIAVFMINVCFKWSIGRDGDLEQGFMKSTAGCMGIAKDRQ